VLKIELFFVVCCFRGLDICCVSSFGKENEMLHRTSVPKRRNIRDGCRFSLLNLSTMKAGMTSVISIFLLPMGPTLHAMVHDCSARLMTDHYETFKRLLKAQTPARQRKLALNSCELVSDVLVANSVMCSPNHRSSSDFLHAMAEKHDLKYYQVKEGILDVSTLLPNGDVVQTHTQRGRPSISKRKLLSFVSYLKSLIENTNLARRIPPCTRCTIIFRPNMQTFTVQVDD